MEIARGMEAARKEILLSDAAGCISGEFIYLYPPGIPLVTPGEVITQELLHVIRTCKQRNMQVQGMEDLSGERIRVVLEK